ncbi:MAG: hypothetical protein ABIP30_15660 [Ferruginibacter sp.]
MPNQNIDIKLHQIASCLICSFDVIGTAKSDANGNFSVATSFDTSLLKKYFILVTATATANYIYYPRTIPAGDTEIPKISTSLRFDHLDTTAFKQLQFGFYPKILLKINMHRVSDIIPDYPSISQSYEYDNHTAVGGFLQNPANKDTTLSIYTTTNIFTRIITYKATIPANVAIINDSIMCKAGINNSIDINY